MLMTVALELAPKPETTKVPQTPDILVPKSVLYSSLDAMTETVSRTLNQWKVPVSSKDFGVTAARFTTEDGTSFITKVTQLETNGGEHVLLEKSDTNGGPIERIDLINPLSENTFKPRVTHRSNEGTVQVDTESSLSAAEILVASFSELNGKVTLVENLVTRPEKSVVYSARDDIL